MVHRGTTKRPSGEEMVIFSGDLADARSGISRRSRAWSCSRSRMKTPRYRGAIAEIASNILNGDKLSDCFAMHPDLFTENVVALIRAGEESGQIAEVFKQIAATQGKAEKVLKKLGSQPGLSCHRHGPCGDGDDRDELHVGPCDFKALFGHERAACLSRPKIMMAFSDMLMTRPILPRFPFSGCWRSFRYWSKLYAIPQVHMTLTRLAHRWEHYSEVCGHGEFSLPAPCFWRRMCG